MNAVRLARRSDFPWSAEEVFGLVWEILDGVKNKWDGTRASFATFGAKCVMMKIRDIRRSLANVTSRYQAITFDTQSIDYVDESQLGAIDQSLGQAQAEDILERMLIFEDETNQRIVRERFVKRRKAREIAAEIGVTESAVSLRIRQMLPRMWERLYPTVKFDEEAAKRARRSQGAEKRR